MKKFNSSGALFAGATDLSRAGNLAASITKQGTVAIWSIETRRIVQTLPAAPISTEHPYLISSLVYSADGHRLAATGPNGEVIFWEIP
jgi:WD40 repeat protein